MSVDLTFDGIQTPAILPCENSVRPAGRMAGFASLIRTPAVLPCDNNVRPAGRMAGFASLIQIPAILPCDNSVRPAGRMASFAKLLLYLLVIIVSDQREEWPVLPGLYSTNSKPVVIVMTDKLEFFVL